jgi:hypothetical protein
MSSLRWERINLGKRKYVTLDTTDGGKRVPFGFWKSILFLELCTVRENSKMGSGTEFSK